jgi:hypothetical protein
MSPATHQASVTGRRHAVCMSSGNNNVTYAHLMFCICVFDMMMMIYLLTAIGLTPGGSSTRKVCIYTQTIYRRTQLTQTIHRTSQITNWEECGPCPISASYTLAFALKLRKRHGKTLSQGSRRMPVGTIKTEYTEQNIHNNKNT